MLKINRLRKDLQFNKFMESIIEVLKGVASAEYLHLQAKRRGFEAFDKHFKDFFKMVEPGNFHHSFLKNPSRPNNIVLITSDTGFLGKLNMTVVNSALEQYSSGDLLTVMGRQGERYLQEQGMKFSSYPGIDDNISYSGVVKLREHIISRFLNDGVGGAIVIYPHFISFAVQRVEQFQLLPCRFLFPQDSKIKTEREPSVMGLWQLSQEEEVIIEPSLNRVVEYLVRTWIDQFLYLIFWESKLSEWAARVMHLEKSSTEIKNQNKGLRFKYFRLLHQRSDKSIREIFSSRLALEKSEVTL